MRGKRRKGQSSRFHVEGWHPAVAAGAGAFGFAAIAVTVLLALLWVDNPAADPSWALPVFVTAIAAGGAAGLTMKNLNLKRAESRRGANLMFDSQFETGARLLGGETESEIIAGSLLLSSLLRESPRHAQACADLLCASLRVRRITEMEDGQFEHVNAIGDEQFLRDLATTHRIRNAVTRAIANATAKGDAPAHLPGLSWEFADVSFGDHAELRGCVFGRGSYFKNATIWGSLDLTGSEFSGNLEIVGASAFGGVRAGGVGVGGELFIKDSRLGTNPKALGGVYLEGARLRQVTIEDLSSSGPLHLDTSSVEGRLLVQGSTFSWVSFIDGSCLQSVLLEDVKVADYICVRRTRVSKGVLVKECTAGGEIEVTGVATLGSVDIVDCTYAELKTGDSDSGSLWASE